MIGVVVLNRISKVTAGEPSSVVVSPDVHNSNNAINVCLPSILAYTQMEYIEPADHCLPEEEIENDDSIRVIKNVRFLRDAKVVVYLEEHEEVKDHILQVKTRRILSGLQPKTRHTALVEGVSSNVTFPCHEYVRCTYPEQGEYPATSWPVDMPASSRDPHHNSNSRDEISFSKKDVLCGVLYNRNRVGIFYKETIDNKYYCAGWDDPSDFSEIFKKLDQLKNEVKLIEFLQVRMLKIKEILEFPRGDYVPKNLIVPLLDEMQTALQNHIKKLPKYLRQLREYLQNREQIILNMGSDFFLQNLGSFGKKVNDKISKAIATQTEISAIEKRNQVMIQAIKKSSKRPGITFVTMGRDHLIPPDRPLLFQFKNLQDVRSDEAQYSLATYLESVPHAVIFRN